MSAATPWTATSPISAGGEKRHERCDTACLADSLAGGLEETKI